MNPSKHNHPYPEDAFRPLTKTDIKKISGILRKAGYDETRVFAHFARIGYDAAIRKLEPKTVGDIK